MAVTVPPDFNAVPSGAAAAAPTQHDGHPRSVAEHGRMGWREAAGCVRRAPTEMQIARCKRVISHAPRSHTDGRQATEIAIAAEVLNRSLRPEHPEYVRIG